MHEEGGMAGKQIIDFGWGYEQGFGYSQAVRVGDLVMLAGQMPCDASASLVAAGDIKGQTRKVFENMKANGSGITHTSAAASTAPSASSHCRIIRASSWSKSRTW